jgi:branched-chain amino acid transport system ATP-binding protein
MLQLKSVDAGYGTFQALFGVNLEVNAGEAVGVIGPNGAGKTTLMRVISGLIRPTKGAITMEAAVPGGYVFKREHRFL